MTPRNLWSLVAAISDLYLDIINLNILLKLNKCFRVSGDHGLPLVSSELQNPNIFLDMDK